MNVEWCRGLRRVLVLFLLSALLPAWGADRLETFLAQTHSLRAEFTQEVRDMDGQVLQRSSGVMMLSQPNRFRWDYEVPSRQVVVSDGKTLWLYDPDLEQVTVKPLDQVLANTPALLLGVDLPALKKEFQVSPLATSDGLEWFELLPRNDESVFRQVLIGFRGETLERMELFDHLGQSTQLQFSGVEVNPKLDAARFHFTPPPGVDVIGAEG